MLILVRSCPPLLLCNLCKEGFTNNLLAAQRSKQGFEFVNCGADIVAVTAWMSTEMAKLKDLLAVTDTEN